MNRLQVCLLLFCLSAAAGVVPAVADPIPFYNTGLAADGSPLAAGAADPHYTLIYASDPNALAAYGTDPNGAWTTTSGAGWISPGSSGSQGWAGGYYVYETTLDLTGYDQSTARLSGLVSADNAVSIYLNQGGPALFTSNAGFNTLTPFEIDGGFVGGLNLVDFVVYNDSGPTGLLVADTMAQAETAEPASFLLLGSGLAAGMFFVFRRPRAVLS